jgi:hypothetical protein
MRKILVPPTWVLSVSIAFVGMVALVGIAFGVWAINATQEQATRAEANKARAEAVYESNCRILGVLRVKPGDTPPSTPRGVEQAEAVEKEYRSLGCR